MDTGEQLSILKNISVCAPFHERIKETLSGQLLSQRIEILQINTGRRCNLSCRHCHVEAGPSRTEMISKEILEKCLEIASAEEITTIDVTGGAPEMCHHLEWFLEEAASLNKRLIVRSNLAILLDPEYARFIDLYADNRVEVVASLPNYQPERTDRQRGEGVFQKVIQAMKLLNDKGYGRKGSGLVLDIVHNPVGTYLPGDQASLEAEYRKRLGEEYGVYFNTLFCITNIPVGRYLEYLIRSDNLEDYMADLCGAYNPSAAANLMCRTTLSVGWDGTLYDCDFNQMLDMPVNHGAPDDIFSFDFNSLKNRTIVTGNHCYGCTAGSGSSCQGVTTGGDRNR